MTTDPDHAAQGRARHEGLRAEVLQPLLNGLFRLRLDDGRELVAHPASDSRMALVRLLPGDAVVVDVSPFDPAKGRIRSLLKSSSSRSVRRPSPSNPEQREQS